MLEPALFRFTEQANQDIRNNQIQHSGNAKGTPPHLHYGIYGINGARNPHPLLRDAPDDWE